MHDPDDGRRVRARGHGGARREPARSAAPRPAGAPCGSTGGGDCLVEAPSAKTWSSVAVPPPDEVGVPPTVIARYSLPSTE